MHAIPSGRNPARAQAAAVAAGSLVAHPQTDPGLRHIAAEHRRHPRLPVPGDSHRLSIAPGSLLRPPAAHGHRRSPAHPATAQSGRTSATGYRPRRRAGQNPQLPSDVVALSAPSAAAGTGATDPLPGVLCPEGGPGREPEQLRGYEERRRPSTFRPWAVRLPVRASCWSSARAARRSTRSTRC